MADFTEAIDVLKDEADRNRAAAGVCRGKEAYGAAESWTKDARNLDRAAAVLEAVGEISAADWIDMAVVMACPRGEAIAAKFAALRDAVEGK